MSTGITDQPAVGSRWLQAAGAVSALVGASGIVGYAAGPAALIRLSSDWFPLTIEASVGLLMVGVAAVCLARGLFAGRAFSLAALGVGLVSLAGGFLGIDLSLDRLAAAAGLQFQGPTAARLPQDTALCITLLGSAFLFASRRRWRLGYGTQITAILGGATAAIAFTALVGSALALASTPGGPGSQVMTLAFRAAWGFGGLGAALLAASWSADRLRTRQAPQWASTIAVIVLAVMAAALFRAQVAERQFRIEESTHGQNVDGPDRNSWLPELTLAFGILTAILVGLTVDQILSANRRTGEAESARRLLERITQERKQDILELQRSQQMLRLYATELQRKNEEFDTALRTAREAAEHKSRFVANTSHEIRTPMNGILGMTELLLTSPLNPQQRELAKTVKESADALLRILNDILDFSKVEAGKMEFENVPFDPGETLASVVSLLTPRAVESKLRIQYQLDAGVPEHVGGDPVRLRQVLVNLIGNALKFTEKGGVQVRAQVSERASRQVRLRFEVIDTGIGIPMDKIDAIFESFTQVDASSTRRHGGTGLGLAISRQLVEGMGGHIGVASSFGAGTTFWFEIPYSVVNEDAHAASIPPSRETEPAKPVPTRVLLVEDNPINRHVAQRMLEREGCLVHPVENGEMAVRALELKPYDAVFMDVQMPLMDGLQATRLIRTSEGSDRRTPIVAMTAGAMECDRERCFEAGMDDYMAKPISQEGVRRMVTRWARAKRGLATEASGSDSLSAA